MPYSLERKKSGYVVVNEITGKTYSEPISKEKASAQLRILKSVMNKTTRETKSTNNRY